MSQTTTALLSYGTDSPSKLEQVAIGELKSDEALVEIQASGICHTDLSCMDGTLPSRFPCVFGHEGAGKVVSVGNDIKHVQPGDSVLLSFASCGSCEQCKDGHPSYCYAFLAHNFAGCRPDGTSVLSLPKDSSTVYSNFFGQSSFARRAVVHASSLVRVSPDTNLELFAPLGCGLQTGAGCVFNTLNVQAGKSVAIWGVGGVGFAALMAAKIRGANPIIAIDLNSSRLTLATKLGATHTIDGASPDIAAEINKIAPPNGVKYAVECTGVPKVIERMIETLGTRGRGATIGAPAPGTKVSVDVFSQLAKGAEYVGCCEGDSNNGSVVRYLLEEHSKGNFPLEELITFYDVKDFEKAIKDTKDGKTVKAVLRWSNL